MKKVVLITTAVIALWPLAARSDPSGTSQVIPAKARTLAERGRAAHDAGRYDEAIALFKEAYVIAPSPSLLFNIAQAYRLEGNCDDAAIMYRRYLETGPDAPARTLATDHLATVSRCTHQRGLPITVDTTLGQVAVPAPESHKPEAPREDHRTSMKKPIGIGLTIGGAVSTGVALYYGIKAHEASSVVEAGYMHGTQWKDLAQADAAGERAATLAKTFGIAGGLAVVTGVTLYVLGERSERTPPVAVVPTKHGAEVAVAWQF